MRLTTYDRREVHYLKSILSKNSIPYKRREQSRFIKAIENEEVKRAGVEASRQYARGAIGLLEREQGKKGDTVFYFSRAFRIGLDLIIVENLFNLEYSTTPYAYQEKESSGTR